jgi:hypothetical protein
MDANMKETIFRNILRDFCAMKMFCDITGEILDYRNAVILKQGDSEQVISKNGLKALIKKHGAEKVNKIVATADSYFNDHSAAANQV